MSNRVSRPGAVEMTAEGRICLPREVEDALRRGQSVIPIGTDKEPLVKWTELQKRQPKQEEVKEWVCSLFDKIQGWGRITGQMAGIIVLDDDTKDGRWFREFGLKPHVRTGRGGLHWIGKHPGWPVKTVNSKSSKRHTEIYPGLDIRGDKGFSVICGFTEKGGYEWLRDPEPDELDVLPLDVREFFGLLEPPKEPEEVSTRERSPSASLPVPGGGPTSEYLIERALEEAKVSGRNNGGAWLVEQLRDHGYCEAEIIEVGEDYVPRCPDVNMKLEPEPYTMSDFQKTVKSILSRPAREKWGEIEGASIVFEDFAEELAANKSESNGNGSSAGVDIDRYLVPIEKGSLQQYPPWAIHDVIRVGHRGVFYAVAGAAKSYAMVDLARAAATGGEWLGCKVKPGSTLYVAAEDYLGIHHRAMAAVRYFQERCGAEYRHQIRVLERAIGITNSEDVKYLRMAIDLLPEKPAYVIIDNLGLCFGDGDPNEGTDAKDFLDGCDKIQHHKWRENDTSEEVRATDKEPITVLIVHHTNKTGNFNGSQYFINYVDMMSELNWNGTESVRTWRCIKQRHGAHHKPLAFELTEVEPASHICVVTSRVLPPAVSDVERARRKLVPGEVRILACLLEAFKERALQAMSGSEVKEGLLRGDITVRSGIAARTVSKYVNSLKGSGLIEAVMVEGRRGAIKPSRPELLKLTEQGTAITANLDVSDVVLGES